MSNIEYIFNLTDGKMSIKIIESSIIVLLTFYTYIKFLNIKQISKINILIIVFSAIIISIVSRFTEYMLDVYSFFLVQTFLIGLINFIVFKKELAYSILTTIIALAFNYVFYIISVAISFIPNVLIKVFNEYVNLFFIIAIYCCEVYNFFRIKRFRNGILYFKKKMENSLINVFIFNIGLIILFLIINLQEYVTKGSKKIWMNLTTSAILLIFTIKQSFNLYYKQNLLTKDLEQTKAELEEKKQEIGKLEKENIEFSKTSHSLAHKQKSLEFKLEKLMKTGVDDKSKEAIKQEIQNISKEIYKEPQQIELPKTEIESIDDMFSYMQSECIKVNIKFELQVVGNPFYMINHLISENELEILLADHIKDAIIAINHSDNTNRCILVRIGKIDNVYSLYIFDSGIEFKKEVLDNLGKKPITTHADSGGTGMGFMNTFDTLNKTKASLIINEIGKPCIDNYTKVLIFKFDYKNEFIVNSYKNKIVVV